MLETAAGNKVSLTHLLSERVPLDGSHLVDSFYSHHHTWPTCLSYIILHYFSCSRRPAGGGIETQSNHTSSIRRHLRRKDTFKYASNNFFATEPTLRASIYLPHKYRISIRPASFAAYVHVKRINMQGGLKWWLSFHFKEKCLQALGSI